MPAFLDFVSKTFVAWLGKKNDKGQTPLDRLKDALLAHALSTLTKTGTAGMEGLPLARGMNPTHECFSYNMDDEAVKAYVKENLTTDDGVKLFFERLALNSQTGYAKITGHMEAPIVQFIEDKVQEKEKENVKEKENEMFLEGEK